MNLKPHIKAYLVSIGILVILLLGIPFIVSYEEDITNFLHTKPFTIETNKSSSLPSEKDITFEEIYRTSIPFGSTRVYGRIYIVHDNKRNVTCYLYKDGISCIPDYYIGVKE